jgi:drug/metabolite transporter (DMT)-like permease
MDRISKMRLPNQIAEPKVAARSLAPPSMPHRPVIGLALGFVGVVLFGATLPMTRLAVASLDPWFVTFGRASAAGLVSVVVLLALGCKPPPRAEWGRYGLVALCLITGFPGFMALAMVTTEASHGAIVMGILPLATAAASAVVTGERPSPAFWLMGLIGAAIVVAFTLRQSGGLSLSIGDLFLLAAVAAAGLGYTLSAVLTGTRPGWEVVSWMLVMALPATLPLTYLTGPASYGAVPVTAWLAFAYLALVSQYIGFFFWNAGLALGGIARVSQVQLLQTFVTLAIAAWLLGEPIGAETLAFAGLVAVVVLFGTRIRSR